MPKSRVMKGRAAIAMLCAGAGLAGAQPSPLPAPTFARPNLSPAGVESLASGCAVCHGPGGHPAPGTTLYIEGQDGNTLLVAAAPPAH